MLGLCLGVVWGLCPTARAAPDEPALDELAASVARLVACAPGGASGLGVGAPAHDAYCRTLRPSRARFLKRFREHVAPVLSEVVPAHAGRLVVYPFGGGDLLTALGTFPDAAEITTLSLEPAGDLRTVKQATVEELEAALQQAGDNLRRLMAAEHSKTTNLSAMARGILPAEIVFSLFALDAWGFELVSFRYFDLAPDGALVYVDAAELAARDRAIASRGLKGGARAALFPHVEMTFRRPGATDLRVFRHLAGNLADAALRRDGRLLAHLRAKGTVLAMTKAASYLLWWDGFSMVRAYLAENAAFMVSDSTGLPPDVAQAHGLTQTTYGWFTGPFLPGANRKTAAAFAEVWKSQPLRPIRFHYGYPDASGRGHMLVTRREAEAP